MSFNNVNVNVSGPVQPTSTYKTKVLKGNHSFASQVTEPNMKYVIKHDFVLDGDVTVPANCVLEFDGGSLASGTIIGNDTVICSSPTIIFKENLAFSGTWMAEDYLAEWFGGDVEKCLEAFNNVSFIKETILSSPITIRNYCSINFKANISVKVSDDYSDDYLFYINTEYSDIKSYKIPKIVFNGCGGNTIDLNNKTCFMKQFSDDHVQMIGLNVIKAAKASENECAIVWTNFSFFSTDCFFAADRQNEDNHPNYGMKLGGIDNKIAKLHIIINTIGIYGCNGGSMFHEIHIWGAPKIAFVITNNCILDTVYSDWGRTSFFVTRNTTLNISNFFFVAPSKNDPLYSDYHFITVKCPQGVTLKGFINAARISNESYNCDTFAYGSIDDVNNENVTLFIPDEVTTNIDLSKDASKLYPFNKIIGTNNNSVSLNPRQTIRFCNFKVGSRRVKLFMFASGIGLKTSVECLINTSSVIVDTDTLNISNKVKFYRYTKDDETYLYIKNIDTNNNIYIFFNKSVPREDGGEFYIDGKIYTDDNALFEDLGISSIDEMSLLPYDFRSILYATTAAEKTETEKSIMINHFRQAINIFSNNDFGVIPYIVDASNDKRYWYNLSYIPFYKASNITEASFFVSSYSWIKNILVTGEIKATSISNIFNGGKTIIVSPEGAIKTGEGGAFKINGSIFYPNFNIIADNAAISGYPAKGTFYLYNNIPVWSTGSGWVNAAGESVEVVYPNPITP